MQDVEALFEALRTVADPGASSAVEALIRDGSDIDLARINPLTFAADRKLADDVAIAAMLYATQLGLLDMFWNVLCPSCGGVLDANTTLKSLRQQDYHCAFCALTSEPRLDDTVEVSFGLSGRVRRIAAHDPDSLGFWDYHRQIFFSSSLAFPPQEHFDRLSDQALIEAVELRPGERMILPIDLAQEPVIVFDPVTHTALVVEVEGETTPERQDLTLVFNAGRGDSVAKLRPGSLRLTLDNRAPSRVLAGVFLAGAAMNELIGGRQRFLTAKQLLSNQTFRDLYRTDTLAIDQRLKITSLTFLFTDLKGSTELYEQVGDLVAYDLVRAHFRLLHGIVGAEGGAVVKTIGDAVMATFPTPPQAIAAALRMREAMKTLNEHQNTSPLTVKIGIHAGPCLAVSLNDRLDYFGQTVNIASRVQNLAATDSIFATNAVVANANTASLLAERHVETKPLQTSLRGIGDRVPVFELG